MEARASLYDGETAVRHRVAVAPASGGGLVLTFADGRADEVPAARLTHVETRPDCRVYGRDDAPGWRLILPRDDAEALAFALPREQKYGRWIDRVGLGRAVAAGAALSAAVLVMGWYLPEWAAPYVPKAWEDRFGDALVGDFGGKFCSAPAGQQALKRLAHRLSPSAGELNIRVVDIGIVNAAALPGGNIVIFEELLEKADGPDEVAGVLAHEIAHIEERHVTEALIRELGLGLVISGLGGNTGGHVNALLSASYSRGAEREADDGAIRMLSAGAVSPLPTAGFFARLAREEAKLGRVAQGLSYLSTHPLSADRQRLFQSSAKEGQAYRPSLTAEEWKALRGICSERADK